MTAQEFIRQELDAGRLTLAHIEALTRDAQAGRPGLLKVDGKPGDQTRTALEKSFPELFRPSPKPDRLEAAGQAALAEAKRLYALDVCDPKADDNTAKGKVSKAIIDGLLKSSGWGWVGTYKGDGVDPNQNWCGVFAHECWRAAGMKPNIYNMASTARLAGCTPGNPGLDQVIDHAQARAGDIVVMGDGDPWWGEHIGIFDFIDNSGFVHTYEGNGTGQGPDGRTREGIVRGLRPLIGKWRVLGFYRPSIATLAP